MSHQRLAVISTHPVQYHSHWFRALAARPELDVAVFYCYEASSADQARAGFGVEFEWDLPLLEGYRYLFLDNHGRETSPNLLSRQGSNIKRLLAREQYDAILVNGWHYRAAWQTIFFCWTNRIPVMVRGDSQLGSPRSALKRYLKYPAYRSFIPRIDACLAAGSRSREYYLHYGARPERIFFVPHVIPDHFMCSTEQAQLRRDAARHHWAFEEHQVVFLWAGKFIEKKRPMDFLSALEGGVGKNSRVAGLMVGDGPLRSSCEQFVRSRSLPVTFAGFLNQTRMVDAYVAADALVLPSDGRETWGIVVNEAMACRRPAFVSEAVGCAPDLVHNGRTGAVFALGDVAALGKLMAEAADDPVRLRAMGECARAGLARYSIDAAVGGVLDAIWAVEKR